MLRFTDNHAPRLMRAAPDRVTPVLGRQLVQGADSIVKDAQHSIIDGAISGPGHIPSLPGDPPNADTHTLDQSGHVVDLIETPGSLRSGAVFDAPYALFLELGTSRVHERPFLRPATQRQRSTLIHALVLRFREAIGF